MLAGKVEILIPRRTVYKSTFEIVQARDGRPSPRIQDTTRINKDMARIIQNNTFDNVLNLNVPFTSPIIPLGSNNLMRNPGLFAQVTSELEPLEIIVYLGTWGVRARPRWIGIKRPDICVRRIIARAPRIPVLVPGPADIGVLLVDLELEVVEVALELVAH